MAKQDNSQHNEPRPSTRGRRSGSPSASTRDPERRARFWWRLAASVAALWWLGATVGDGLLERWWLQDAQGDAGASGAPSTWSPDFWRAHLRLEAFRWGGAFAGALLCGGWAWRQGHLAIANARESEASLGLLWSHHDDAFLGGVDGSEEPRPQPTQHTGRWIPLEDKLALDRFRPAAFRVAVGLCAVLGAAVGGRAWPLWMSFWTARPSGLREPWLGQDVAFYLFRLPALDFAWRLLMLAHVLALLLCVAIYLYEDSLQVGRRLWASQRALRHLGLLLALLLAWKAAGAALYPFEMLVARSAHWSGPHATDWRWRVPLDAAAALATLLCAALCVRVARKMRPRSVLGWALAPAAFSWLAVSALPSLRASLISPAQAAREDEPFAREQERWTRFALGFGTVGFTEDRRATLPAAAPSPEQESQLLSAVSERDLASWPGDESALSTLSALPQSARASTWRGSPALMLQQASPLPFEPRSWAERHIDSAPSVLLQRFAVARASQSPQQDGPRGVFIVEDAAPSTRLSQPQQSRVPILVGTDRAESPGLLRDAEIAAAMKTGRAMRQQKLPDPLSATDSWRGNVGGAPSSFFASSFDGSASGLAPRRALPTFRVLGARVPGAATRQAAAAGVPLDAPWKRWLAAWRFGSLSLARSNRLGSEARLAWRLDAAQRCRRLAPFLSWQDAPRPVTDAGGRLFWLLDGYTLSAAFPLARALDTRAAFASPEPDVSRAAPVAASSSEREVEARRSFVGDMIRRQEILARVAHNFDGFNWARASAVALVEASTGRVRLFPMRPDDIVLSLYQRALPEMWSPPQELPPFARAALRTPPHLASLHSSAWASIAEPATNRPASTWMASSYFLVPTARGLRTGILLSSTPAKGGDAGKDRPASTWKATLSAAPSAKGQTWQTQNLEPGGSADWSLVDALVPSGDAWLVRQRSPARAAQGAAMPLPAQARGAHEWERARALWKQAQQAQSRGDGARYDALEQQLGQVLEQNAHATQDSRRR